MPFSRRLTDRPYDKNTPRVEHRLRRSTRRDENPVVHVAGAPSHTHHWRQRSGAFASVLKRFGSRAKADSPPSVLRSRAIELESVPEGGGTEGFNTPAAHEINKARLEHLAALGLPLNGRRVLEVGGGVGHLSTFFLDRDCDLVTTEARPENVAEMRRLYPHLDARIVDVESGLADLGRFDVVFCYGLLYHLENPIRALRNMVEVCDDLLLIETMITD